MNSVRDLYYPLAYAFQSLVLVINYSIVCLPHVDYLCPTLFNLTTSPWLPHDLGDCSSHHNTRPLLYLPPILKTCN